ncbi:MAG: hypothetical protein PSW75_06960 [bacterium]|nr:hypothetical protein [bacterium]MDI1338011.1 hypothetical protein [Lacunisphaera sp.]
MKINLHPLAGLSRLERWLLGTVWLVIALKCLAVNWAIPHYNVPIAPWVVIGPTLFFAAVVTVIWVTHRE